MNLSERLQAVAALAGESCCLADIGTDHGYIPIHLMEQKKIRHAIACDVNKGPLKKAEENISAYRMEDQIETRLSDGLHALKDGDADAIVIAGMGGALTIRILDEGKEALKSVKKMVLQPQSEIAQVRRYLYEHQYHIEEEDMIFEDGKYYPMMLAVPGQSPSLTDAGYAFGPKLMEKKHPVLKAFLDKEEQAIRKIQEALSKQDGERIEKRRQETEEELQLIRTAKELMV